MSAGAALAPPAVGERLPAVEIGPFDAERCAVMRKFRRRQIRCISTTRWPRRSRFARRR